MGGQIGSELQLFLFAIKRYKLVFIKMSCSVKNFRKGHSLTPSLEYYKKNLFVKNLDLLLTANL